MKADARVNVAVIRLTGLIADRVEKTVVPRAGSASASGCKLSGWPDNRYVHGRKLTNDDNGDDYHHDHHHDHHWWWWIGR